MGEVLVVAFIFVAMPFVVIAFVSWLLHYFVALNSPPKERALWIVGIGYVVASVVWLFGGPEGDRWEGPFAAIPAAALLYWWWRRDFREAWIDDAHGVPDGVELANTDWRVGLLGVAGLFVVAAIKVLFVRSAVGQS